jgi:hypothetical protein
MKYSVDMGSDLFSHSTVIGGGGGGMHRQHVHSIKKVKLSRNRPWRPIGL